MNVNIRRLLYSPRSPIIISIIIGFGLATIFRKTCSLRGCYVFKGPSLSKVENKVFQMGEKCYTYKPHHTSCKTIQSKVIDFA